MTPRELAAAVHEERRLVWMKWMVEQGYVSDWMDEDGRTVRDPVGRWRRRLLLLHAPVRAGVRR